MRLRLTTILLALTAAALAAPAAALAEFFPGDPVDGPSADIVSVSDVELARDGTGAIAYLKRDGGVDHVYVARMLNGSWQAPERIDGTLTGPSSNVALAASDQGRLIVAFENGGAVHTVTRAAGASSYVGPTLLSQGATAPAADISINGAAYVSFTLSGDVRVARFERDGSTGAVVDQPLDVDPARSAGGGDSRSRIAVSAEGSGVVIWGEEAADGRTHVYARRVFGPFLSKAPQDLTLNTFEGRAGGSAGLPDIEQEDDSSYAWAVFRQTFDDGGVQRPRVIARRLVGSAFEAPSAVDAAAFGGEGATAPRIDMTGRGVGVATSSGAQSGTVFADFLFNDLFDPPQRLDTGGSAVAPMPAPAVSENNDAVVAWRQAATAADPAAAHARRWELTTESATVPAVGPDVVVSRPELGPVAADGGFAAAADRGGDVAMAFVQGAGADRRLVAAVWDRPPGSFLGYTSTAYRPLRYPDLVWQPSFELWGPLTYRVEIDGKPAGETDQTKITSMIPVADGLHTWRVVATDRRGQTAVTKTRNLRVDATGPRLSVGVRRSGRTVRLSARARDVRTGLSRIRVSWGDGVSSRIGRVGIHSYRRGTWTLRVIAIDRAGARTTFTRTVRIG